ncbi:hypothetical protein K3495_g5019 [Podosphaera aphanis]|nr:hypothetical protein K3495_g5019 [Podosphaera aphanis]
MPVQAATLHELLKNRVDCLAQAKTGTGKTIAFLLPAIQNLINMKRPPGSNISLVAISPTRELALQIAKEANQLLQNLPQYKVCVAIGGTNKNAEIKRIMSGCDILIATPGRFLDHLNDNVINSKLKQVDTLVLDEADRLLDMGFMNDLKKIVGYLPDKQDTKRQGMLFSATIAPHVEKVAHLVLGKDYKFISTIPKGEVNTHQHVQQNLITVPSLTDALPALVGNLQSEMKSYDPQNFKAIVFAPTAALADLYVKVLQKIDLHTFPPLYILHSRLSQGKRTSTTNTFRESKNGILIATDVVARGMDFPAVTHVIQVGVPQDRESYIHRLGRTARAGAEGKGTFIVSKEELFFTKSSLKEIKFVELPADLESKDKILSITEKLGPEYHRKIYQAWLGYYKNHLKSFKWTTEQLVEEGNKFALEFLRATEIPALQRSTISKMGLKGVQGLRLS